jgi:hypothetical protein
MSDDAHERAERLMIQARVEAISPEERDWLDQHIEECARCASLSGATERALRSLRSVAVRVDPELVRRTQLIVRFRADQLERDRAGMLPVWVCCAFSWILGVVTAPLLWRGFEWLGRHAGVPNIVWQAGFVAWWLLPALVAVAVLALRREVASD